jgi:hypothetical protein
MKYPLTYLTSGFIPTVLGDNKPGKVERMSACTTWSPSLCKIQADFEGWDRFKRTATRDSIAEPGFSEQNC